MKIIHTSDLHLGQVIYQHYDRADEHDWFFSQLARWCDEERPDALLVTGDIFDIQQPSASTWQRFTHHFVDLHRRRPDMPIILIAGNHDSPSRLHSHKLVWQEIGTRIVALAPPVDAISREDGWENDFIIELPTGYIVALPYMAGQRGDVVQHLLDKVAQLNVNEKPVVMTGHLAVTDCDIKGHDIEIGNLRTIDVAQLGTGYDYLALGHIHRPQTYSDLEKKFIVDDSFEGEVSHYSSPVVRYAGSVLHVSCDETYPHTVSVVEIDTHNGEVSVRTRRIEELRHFFVIPRDNNHPVLTAKEALEQLEEFASEGMEGYFRFRLNRNVTLPSDFSQRVYAILEKHDNHLRYNPKIDWTGEIVEIEDEGLRPKFEVAELQQMSDPMQFIEKTITQYPGLDLEDLRDAFNDIKAEIHRMAEAEKKTFKKKKS